MLHSKTMTQVLLLLLGGAMVLFGVWRGEAGVEQRTSLLPITIVPTA